MMSRAALQAYLDVVDAGSIQAAAKRSGRSRATYHRCLDELRHALGGRELLQRRPGQRQVVPTPVGKAFEPRARAILARWHQWQLDTQDALGVAAQSVRIGALSGAFDLLAAIVMELAEEHPPGTFRIIEYPADQLRAAVSSGAVDLGVGTAGAEGLEAGLAFDEIGPLPWSVIVPARQAQQFGDPVSLLELHEVPMVVHRRGPARTLLERCFEAHPEGPLSLVSTVEVQSTPRMVDMVAKGFGPAIVTRFRLQFLPEQGVLVRALTDGPAPLVAGIYTRRGLPLAPLAQTLWARTRSALLDVVQGGQEG